MERPRSPADPAEIDVRVLVEEVERLADIREAGGVGGAAAEFGDESLAVVRLEEGDEGLEAGGDFVGDAGGGSAGPVRVEVVVHVEDEFRGRAIGVFHAVEGRRGAVRYEGPGGGVARAGKEDQLTGGAGFADGCYGGLDGLRPGVYIRHYMMDVSAFERVDGAGWIRYILSWGSFINPITTFPSPAYFVAS